MLDFEGLVSSPVFGVEEEGQGNETLALGEARVLFWTRRYYCICLIIKVAEFCFP